NYNFGALSLELMLVLPIPIRLADLVLYCFDCWLGRLRLFSTVPRMERLSFRLQVWLADVGVDAPLELGLNQMNSFCRPASRAGWQFVFVDWGSSQLAIVRLLDRFKPSGEFGFLKPNAPAIIIAQCSNERIIVL